MKAVTKFDEEGEIIIIIIKNEVKKLQTLSVIHGLDISVRAGVKAVFVSGGSAPDLDLKVSFVEEAVEGGDWDSCDLVKRRKKKGEVGADGCQ